MHENSIEFHYYPMDNKDRILNYIKETHEHKTVPIITIETDNGEELIGGYDDLVKHFRQQEDKESNKSDS